MKKVWTYLVIAFIALLASVNYELFVFPNQFARTFEDSILCLTL